MSRWLLVAAMIATGCGSDDANNDAEPNNSSENASENNGAENSSANNEANNVERTNTQGCFATSTCNDDVEAACRRFVDNYYACVELAYEGDPEQIALEKEKHEDTCDPVVGLFSDSAAETFHCQADAFGAADCATTEGLNTVLSQSSDC